MPSGDVSTVEVVGIGADGWAGLAPASRDVLRRAKVVLGAPRQLALLDDSDVSVHREPLPSPLQAGLPGALDALGPEGLVVLASGDPMFFGIGSTLIDLLGAARVRIHPHPSSVSLAAARLGWRLEDVDVVSLVGRSPALLNPMIQPGRRVLVLVSERDGARRVRRRLDEHGYRRSTITVLSLLGGPQEHIGTALDEHDPLTLLALECVPDAGVAPLPRVPGLPEDAYEQDGQITKREIRALALAMLAPVPGQLLWDVGAGSGSVGIEWMRVDPASQAIAIEARADRRERIARNAQSLGVPGLRIVAGSAPDAMVGLPAPDAVFVGGGVSGPGLLDVCVAALAPGGRLVANGVTIETETVLADWYARLGGTLTRLAVQRAEPVGRFTGWRAAMPVTQWAWRKENR